jgi:hypothetical protein
MKQKLFRTANFNGRSMGNFASTFVSRLFVLALPLMLIAFPTLGMAQTCVFTPASPPGKVYPLFQWRLDNNGRLPQTHEYRMEEDRITMTIEDGASRGIGPNAMMIVLRSAPNITWRKEIAAWNSRLGQTTVVATQDGNHGPISMLLTPETCFNGASTIIFRKQTTFSMWDMYHLDIANFWRVLSGKVVTFTWVYDGEPDPFVGVIRYPYPMPCETPCLPVGSGPNNWYSLGGWLTSDVAVGQNADGRLEVFMRGTDGGLHHKWQLSPGGVWPDTWSNWNSLDQPSVPLPVSRGLIGKPAVARNADGRLEVFVRASDSMLWHKYQLSPGGAWSDWSPLEVELKSDPVVGQNADGRLQVFWRGTDGALHHKWQLSPGGGWFGGQASLGGGLIGNPAVGLNVDGRLDVFVQGTNGVPYHIWQLSAGSYSWSGFTPLDGRVKGSPAVGRNSDGRLALFVRGTNDELYHKSQLVPGGNWSGWETLNGRMTSDPVVGQNTDGRLQVFVRGTDAGLYSRIQIVPGGNWAGWERLGGGLVGNPAVGRMAGGSLEVFMRGDDAELHYNWQITPGGSWASR